MTLAEQILTVLIAAAATQFTRFAAFIFFAGKKTPAFLAYLGKCLPGAVFALLVVYCLKDVSVFTGLRGIPEAAGIAATVLLHLWKRQMLLSIAGGTALYMLFVQTVFA